MDTNNKKVISKEKVVFPVPPDLSKLQKLTNEELDIRCSNLGLDRSQIENIKDEDKRRVFMINESLRIDPPIPKTMKPILINTEYNKHDMKKTITFKYVKHIFDKVNKNYNHSILSIEKYTVPLQMNELYYLEKSEKENKILEEIKGLTIEDYTTRESILKFSCDNGKSNGEKRLRMVLLQKYLQVEQDKISKDLLQKERETGIDTKKPRYQRYLEKTTFKHHRITNHEISIY